MGGEAERGAAAPAPTAMTAPVAYDSSIFKQSSVAPSEKLKMGGEAERGAAAPAPTGGEDIPSQIRAIGALRDEGLLTDAEFDAKKKELLAKI